MFGPILSTPDIIVSLKDESSMQITFGSSFWKSSLKKMEIKYQIYMFILIPLDQKYPALLSSSTFPA